MTTPHIRRPVDCPACGASARSRLAISDQGPDGTDLSCEVCGLLLWSGTLVDRGREITRETVIRRVRAARPDIGVGAAFVEPWDRRKVLGLVSAATVPMAETLSGTDQLAVVVIRLPSRDAGVA